MPERYFEQIVALEEGCALPWCGFTVTEVTTYQVATDEGVVVFESRAPEIALEQCERLAALSRAPKQGGPDASGA